MIISSHSVSPPDTKGPSIMLQLNNITIGKLTDIKSDDSIVKKEKRIADLFLYDGLDEIYKMNSEQKNLNDSPWNAPSSELLLKKGKNFLHRENLS